MIIFLLSSLLFSLKPCDTIQAFVKLYCPRKVLVVFYSILRQVSEEWGDFDIGN